MNLLDNAVESIKVGMEDYESGERSRLRSAVRSIHSGILLLYKEALRRLSPAGSAEVLIKKEVRPVRAADGTISFVGHGKKTVDVHEIKNRFSSLGVTTNWTRFDHISSVRNDIEHYIPTATKAALEGVISDACVIVRDFIVRELGGDPRVLLGDDTWQSMLDVSEVHEAERKACEEALGAIEWDSSTLEIGVGALSCDQCGSGLLRPEKSPASSADVDLICSKCGARQTPEEYVPKAVGEALAHEGYVAMTDGGETPLASCPECFEEAYVIEEERCALCGHEAAHDCARCGSRILPEELGSSPLCGYCDHMMSKDD